MQDPMRRFLRSVRRRLRLAWLAETAQAVAPFATGALALLALADWLVPQRLTNLTALGLVAATATLGLLVRALTIRITDWDAARAAERSLRLRDVLTTSLEFNNASDPMHRHIQKRAANAISSAKPKRAVPIPSHPDRLARATGFAAAAAILALLPALGGSSGASDAIQAILEEEAVAVEQIADAVERADIENNDDISRELRELAAEIRNSESLDHALRALDRTERQLEAGADPRFLSQKAAIQGLSRELALRPLAGGAPLDAASQLEAIAEELADKSPEELAALRDRLQELAAAQSSGNPGLANDLASAASALANRSTLGARDALNSAAASQRSGLGEARQTQALNETLAALDRIAARLGAGGNPSQLAQGAGSGEGTGQGQGAGQGAGQGSGRGTGQGAGQGQGGQGGGSPTGQISGVRGGEGGAGGQGGEGTVGPGGEAIDDPRDVATSSVFQPILEGNTADQVQVGIDGGSGQGSIVGRADAPTQAGESLVPYTQNLPTYLAEAADALARMQLPPSLRDIVRNYFDLLAEEAR